MTDLEINSVLNATNMLLEAGNDPPRPRDIEAQRP
jgi:hypothetical protein